jgi:hypothetical protein
MLQLHVTMKGPTVEGLAEPMLTAALDASLAEVADYTKHEVDMRLMEVLQNPTGYYQSRIVAERVSREVYSVNDGGVIYGPWLEGVSRRNAETRFKGYATFRIVRNRMAQKARAIIDATVAATAGKL